MRIIDRRRMAALVAVVMMCFVGTVTSASASTPALHVGQTAHECVVIGHTKNDIYQGVVCVDMSVLNINGHAYASSRVELICETPTGTEVRCAEAKANGQIWNAVTGESSATNSDAHCGGHSTYPPCTTTRNYFNIGGWGPSNGDCASVNNNVWTVALGGGATSIELPAEYADGPEAWVNVDASHSNGSGNISTGHYYICP